MRLPTLLVCSTLILLGCSDPLGPEDITGAYDLVALRGAEIPGTVVDGDSTIHVLSGSIYLSPHGIAIHSRSMQLDDQLTLFGDRMFAYELDGNEIRWAQLPCIPGRPCGAWPLPTPLTVQGDRLVSSAELGEVYVRQSDALDLF